MVFHAKNPLFDSLMIKVFFLLNGLVGQNMNFWNSVSVPKNNFQSRIKDLDYPSLGVIYGPQINEYQGWPEIKRFLPKNNRNVACRKPRISHYILQQGRTLHDKSNWMVYLHRNVPHQALETLVVATCQMCHCHLMIDTQKYIGQSTVSVLSKEIE